MLGSGVVGGLETSVGSRACSRNVAGSAARSGFDAGSGSREGLDLGMWPGLVSGQCVGGDRGWSGAMARFWAGTRDWDQV